MSPGASVIEQLTRQAIRTFSRKNNSSGCLSEENFSSLKKFANRITAEDVKLNESIEKIKDDCRATYLDIYEDSEVTVGVFVLRSGAVIPLHDHPTMNGMLKVLKGSLAIQAYTAVGSDRDRVVAEKHPLLTLTSREEACTLEAVQRNLHEITNVGAGWAAFLDILAPPYCSGEGRRDCTYFKPVTRQPDDVVVLKKIESPPSFVCTQGTYCGPHFK